MHNPLTYWIDCNYKCYCYVFIMNENKQTTENDNDNDAIYEWK